MTENQFNREPVFQQNQPLQDKLTDNQTQSGNYQEEDSDKRDSNSHKEFPERTQQHEYKNPSADQIDDDEEDEVDTDGEIFNKDHEINEDANNTDPVEEQTDVSNLGLV